MQTHIMHVLLECGSIARIMNMRHDLIFKKKCDKEGIWNLLWANTESGIRWDNLLWPVPFPCFLKLISKLYTSFSFKIFFISFLLFFFFLNGVLISYKNIAFSFYLFVHSVPVC